MKFVSWSVLLKHKALRAFAEGFGIPLFYGFFKPAATPAMSLLVVLVRLRVKYWESSF